MKILSISNCPLDPNLGSGKTVVRYGAELRRLGHEVDTWGPLDYEWAPRLGRGKKFRQALGAWWAAGRRARPGRYDVVEYFGDEFWLLASRLRRQRHRPLLVAHSNGLELLAAAGEKAGRGEPVAGLSRLKQAFIGPLHRRLSPIGFRSADAFVGLCRLDVDYIVDHGILPRRRTALVGPGLDDEYLDLPLDARRRGRRVAFSGSWLWRKGVDQIAQVMTRLLEQMPDLHLDVYGTGGNQGTVLGGFPERLHPRIRVWPRLSNAELAAGLAAARVFFFPSRYEGFGMATAEAMARGCVPVATPTGFGAELSDGVDGFVVPFGDTAAMEARIGQVLTDDAGFERMSQAARARVAGFRWAPVARKLAEHYESWLAEHTADASGKT